MFLYIISAALLLNINTSIEIPPGGFLPAFLKTSEDETVLVTEGGGIGTEPGMPDIASVSRLIPLAPGTAAVSLTVSNTVWEDAGTGIVIRPLPFPEIISRPVSRTAPPSSVYSEDSFWPAEPAALTGTGYPRGIPHAEILVTPFRYNPVTGHVQRLVSLDVEIVSEPRERQLPPAPSTDLERMLIITDQSIREPFDSLAAWRTDQGILTEVVTTGEVYSSPGSDDAEKIRNYIIEYRQENGLDHVLLAGDTNLIPCRFAFPMSYEWNYGREDNMPCDLYFSDLDGNWNQNGNSVWGEVEDDVDLHPDVHVGRAPCEDIEEAWTFWNKIKTYETTDPGHHDETLLAAGVLWTNPFTDDADVKKYIKNNHIPPWFTNTELYQTSGNYSTSSVVSALDQGPGYVNLNDHGWIGIVGPLDNGDVDGVDSNGRFFGMMYSIGCWTSAFDFDSISEHFLNNPSGGGVSYIGNSSYGWGSPGNPLYGYSDRFDRELFKILFEDPTLTLGELVSAAKETYIPFAHQENCYRCVLYMVNLLGDPSQRTYRRAPVFPQIELPDMVSENTPAIPVTVNIPGEYQPEELTVCLRDSGFQNYHVATLDESGHCIITLDSPPQGDITVTVTGTDVRRTTVVIPNSSGPLPAVTAISISTAEGYTSPAPGTEAEITITVTDIGSEPLSAVELTAELVSGPGTLTQSAVSYGAISPGGSSQGSQPLVIQVDQNGETGEILLLNLEISSAQGTWNSSLPLLVHGPGLYFSTFTVDDTAGGNGNGYPEPGESFQLVVDVANSGLLQASGVSAVIFTDEPWFSFTTDSSFLPSIEPEGTGQFTFEGQISPSAPERAFPVVSISTSAEPEWNASEDFMMIIGEFLLSCDFEDGPGGWTHTGTSDMWNLSQGETHSGEWAWWCGDEASGTYLPGMNSSLLSPWLYLAPEAELTFWSCFNVDLYGADGLYVTVDQVNSAIVDTLDFIGAGGLLGTGGRSIDGNMMWLPRTYDLSFIEPGTLIQAGFTFVSDSDDPNEGSFHIDDVTIDGYLDQSGGPGPELSGISGLPRPNPSSGTFCLPVNFDTARWSVRVFDMSGRLVHSTPGNAPFSGDLPLTLSGQSPGIYLIMASERGIREVHKVVVTGCPR